MRARPSAVNAIDDRCAERLKVLADRTRLDVLRRLLVRPHRVGELADELGVEQSLLSHHLRTLREAGLVRGEREGKSVVYALDPEVVGQVSGPVIELGCCRIAFEEG